LILKAKRPCDGRSPVRMTRGSCLERISYQQTVILLPVRQVF
jgi:hypothetical protein